MSSLWLVGAGGMSQDYCKVLESLDLEFNVIGRGKESAMSFEKATGHPVIVGSLQNALKNFSAPKRAIIAVGIEQLASIANELILAGTENLLIEKPGALDIKELLLLEETANQFNANVLIAYNRRFYASVQKLRDYVIEDGGILSCNFEFTEWSHKIEPLKKAKGVKEKWLLGNSSHVIDLAFNLIGLPSDWEYFYAGSISWHPKSARYAGAGISEKKVIFSYHADWEAPGRWGIEIMTRKRRLILQPIEELQVVKIGGTKVNKIELENDLDIRFKPGLYLQTKSFIEGEISNFCTLKEQVKNMKIYSEIAGYI